ncbi:MAG: MBL fold metallo-hydrolase [Bacteroidales bacterium]|jgi:glyoxylase-like metal-dependent hydrolase (beta-lactamase superfamily II)|nr:MBL fold metallo-hydrolase [Bacteroidales bacterium]MDD4384424.1 MBL fold metallo-hydrolase [Bacteroidales bacterium]MDY0196601.1 MBL fold metallo-hydrolase [Tenuifilaceae bacterium]
MKVSSFNIQTFLIDGGAMYGVVPKVLWNKQYPADENNLIPLDLRSLVIETENRVVLIDTGFGTKQSDKFFSHFHLFGGEGLIEGLAKLGYKPADITDVIHTHLHYDHCGGGIGVDENGGYFPVFPNAKYHISQSQWDSALNPNVREADSFLKENILPIKELGLLNPIKKEGPLMPGIELRFFNGHTKGQMIPIIDLHNGKKAVYAADLFPSTAHVHLAWNASYDVEPLVSMEEKEIFLNEAINKNYFLFYQHDHFTECSTLIKTPRGIRAGEKLTLSEILK